MFVPVLDVGPRGSQHHQAPHQQVGEVGQRVQHQQRTHLDKEQKCLMIVIALEEPMCNAKKMSTSNGPNENQKFI
jgi:hypothetical protein